ncbi:putative membrane protein (plasmid) [Bacillus thuringiensis HD1002]|uniref:Membrane protein n=1 Tax=Bacillus thuringiensis TaxID=1428 RepID=A0AB33AQ78_BACTU|nr:putative membrane protein [Bacillus thuringiensis]AJH02659.1 putative membrane protein [Bacillus thuringiensis HD1002]RCX38988.1 hypothetical protein DEU45_105217 [Bacillus sp. AG102]TWE72503.1 hypothetical protein FHW38_105240 [Bacillus thuringiensis]TWG34389.1 hypothetical protein FHX98_6408 [Bacillus sp. AK8]
MLLDKVEKKKKPLIKLMCFCVVWLIVASLICSFTS